MYKLVYVLLRNFYIYDQFETDDSSLETQLKTPLAALLYFLYVFSALLILLSNYYVFYHLVKKYFESKNEENQNNSNERFYHKENDSIQKIKNKEIEEFLVSFKK